MIRRDVWWMDGDLGVSHLSSCQILCFQQAITWGMAMICSIRRQGEAHYVILKGNTQSSCSSWREKGRQKPTGRACFKSLQDRSSVCFQRLCSEPPPPFSFSPFMTPQFSASSTSAQLLKDVDEQHREFKLTSRTHTRQIISVKCSAAIRPPEPLSGNNRGGGGGEVV